MKKSSFIICLLLFSIFSAKLTAQQPYVILTTIKDTNDTYWQAVKALKNYRNAQVISFSANNVDSLLPVLMLNPPRYAAIVVKPIELHINFIRKILMLSTQVDPDPFSDFSYGYITGATGQDALDFVNKIIQADAFMQNYPLKVGGYAASSINYVYLFAGDYMDYLNPVSYSQIYMETSDSATGLNFFLANQHYMLNNKVLDIGHNGDPHMLWLFEGGNTNPNPPVWNYDSTKIEDPAYARVGLTSKHIGALNLYPAVAFNGACHSGEPKKVMIEGDIAATFGNTQGLVKFYTMSDTFSFALSILKTGITGYFAPCGANNANDQSEEMYNAFLFHEPLGDVHKRTIDGVVMGFLGNRPNLRLFTPNTSAYLCDILPSGTFNPNDWPGAYSMLGGKANRIYFGDPLYNPFVNNTSDSLKIAKATIDSVSNSSLIINLKFKKPDVYTAYFPVWEKFHFGGLSTRIYLPVEMPYYVGEVTGFSVIDSSAPYNLVIHALERFDGKYILHIEVDIPNDMYDAINYSIKFLVNFTNVSVDEKNTASAQFRVFPNPASDYAVVTFLNDVNERYSLSLFNSCGQIVKEIHEITGSTIKLDTRELSNGVYLLLLRNNRGISACNRMLIRK